jgi:hypothetical protein
MCPCQNKNADDAIVLSVMFKLAQGVFVEALLSEAGNDGLFGFYFSSNIVTVLK